MKLSLDSHTGKARVLAAIALTAGLGMTGVVSASAHGAHSPSTAPAGHGKRVTCVVRTGPGSAAPSLAVTGSAALPDGKTTVKVENGKVYVNGKPAPKGSVQHSGCGKLPPLPPLPPGGKGRSVVCVAKGAGSLAVTGSARSAGQAAPGGKTTVRIENGKVYVNGKPVPKGRVHAGCGKLPPLPPLG